MLLPARTAVLNYLYKVNAADVNQIMTALKPEYGNERQFNKGMYMEHVLSLEANGLVEMKSYDLDKAGELVLVYQINDDGKHMVEKYVAKKYR